MIQTIDELINEIMMSKSFEVHLVVEGDADRRLFASCLSNPKAINIFPAGGGTRVVDVLSGLDAAKLSVPTLGVIDRDYRHPLNLLASLPFIEMTDYRDIECMMFETRAFDSVLGELGSSRKIVAFGGVDKVKTAILAIASDIATLRFYSQSKKLNIDFKEIDLAKFVDKRTLCADRSKMLAHIGNKQNPLKVIRLADFNAALAAVVAAKYCNATYFTGPYLLCCGHDLMNILNFALKSAVGTHQAKELNPDLIETMFRLAYVAHFKMSALCERITRWFSRNTSFNDSQLWT